MLKNIKIMKTLLSVLNIALHNQQNCTVSPRCQ